MGDLLTFEDMLLVDDEEIDRLMDDYASWKQERAETQHQAFQRLPRYPQLVIDAIDYMKLNYGFLEEGIFRVNGDSKNVIRIRNAYEQGIEDVFSELGSTLEVYDVATALKSYFRALETPLIPDATYESMKDVVDSTDTEDVQVQKLEDLIAQMPSPNKEVLCYVMKFFQEVAAESATNKMTSKNLGTCLTMSLTRFDPDKMGGAGKLATMVEVGLSTKIISLMIDEVKVSQFLTPDEFEDFRSHSCYKPNRLPNPPKNFRKQNSFAQNPVVPPTPLKSGAPPALPPLPPKASEANGIGDNPKVHGAKTLKPKVPPRQPPRNHRPSAKGI